MRPEVTSTNNKAENVARPEEECGDNAREVNFV